MDKAKYAILGFGLFGEGSLLPGFQKAEKSELIAITKRKKTKVKKKAEKYDIPYAYAYEEREQLLQNDEIDAIFIATPNKLHMDDAIACLRAGKDVILEKPMAMNSSECEKILEVQKEEDQKLMIAQCMRYCSGVEYIKSAIDKGEMGDIVSISAYFMSTGKESSRPWKYNKDLAGGGAAFDLGVHMVDLVRFLANRQIKEISHTQRPRDLDKDQVDEYVHFLIDFEGEITGNAIASFLGPRHNCVEVYGMEGYMRTFDFNRKNGTQTIEQDIHGNDIIETKEIKNEDFYTKEIDAFSEAILNESDIPVHGSEGLINQRIIDRVNQEGI